LGGQFANYRESPALRIFSVFPNNHCNALRGDEEQQDALLGRTRSLSHYIRQAEQLSR
jgi:hypothetical protein